MSEPTREQRIQQANLQFDYDEATKRGECWENWQCRPWSSPNVWHDIYCTPFGNVIDCEYRRKPEPPKPIVVSLTGELYDGHLRVGDVDAVLLCGCLRHTAVNHRGADATLTLTIHPEGCEVPDTVVDELNKCLDTPGLCVPRGLYELLCKLAEAVKGGA